MSRPDRGPLAVDRLAFGYLALSGAVAGASLTRTGLAVAAVHGLAVWAGHRLLAGRGAPPGSGRPRSFLRFVRLTWPVLVTPLLYQELSLINGLHGWGYFDPLVQGWERALFGVQLSVVASEWAPSAAASEIFHLGYLSYYALVPGAAVAAYLGGGERALRRFTLSVGAAFFLCYLCFALFPVAGPRYLFPKPGGGAAEAWLFGPTHRFLEASSTKGAAFPSSHVAATVAGWLSTRRASPGWFRGSAVFVALLTLGTVYGRFHYGVDALAGLAVGWAAYLAAPALTRLLGGRGRGS